MLFPDLSKQRFGYLNLNEAAQRWVSQHNISANDRNPLLDPNVCQTMVDEVHRERGLDFSYGGWMEDRRDLWRGSYLDTHQTYIHLGVDFNVPAGTHVAAEYTAEVIRIDSDIPEEGGWGTRVILQPITNLKETSSDVLIYAHLDPEINCRIGDQLKRGDVFANVGQAPDNGGWFSHLHVQCVEIALFEQLLKNDLRDLDGYGAEKDIHELCRYFRDPFRWVSLR